MQFIRRFYLVLINLSILSATPKLKKTENIVYSDSSDQNVTCSKEWFVSYFVDKDIGLSNSFFDQYKIICNNQQRQQNSTTRQCNSGESYITYAENPKTSQFWWLFNAFNLNQTEDDCWGMYADIRSGDGDLVDMQYVNFKSPDTDKLAIYTKAKMKVDYTFSLYPIPYGDKLQSKVKTPGACENRALDTIYQMLKLTTENPSVECNSENDVDFNTRNDLASLVCELVPESPEQQLELIMEKVGVRLNPLKNTCEFYFKTKKTDSYQDDGKGQNYFTPVNIALAVISLVLVVAIIVIIYMYIKCKKRDSVQRVTTLNNTNLHLQAIPRVSYKVQMEESQEYLMIES